MTEAKSGKRVPVSIPEEVYALYRSYSQITGVPVSRAMVDGLKEYAEVVLAVRLETLAEQAKVGKGVLTFPSPLPVTNVGLLEPTEAKPLLTH